MPCLQNYRFNASYAAAAGEQVQREFAVGYRGECGEVRVLSHAWHYAHGHLPRRRVALPLAFTVHWGASKASPPLTVDP